VIQGLPASGRGPLVSVRWGRCHPAVAPTQGVSLMTVAIGFDFLLHYSILFLWMISSRSDICVSSCSPELWSR
jgi:hypothetical protein